MIWLMYCIRPMIVCLEWCFERWEKKPQSFRAIWQEKQEVIDFFKRR